MRIEDHALIGDGRSAALVGRDGTIDWLCLPRFDSPACFASLLGVPDNGFWRIAPAAGDARVSRRYRGDTLVLETLFETGDGAIALIDFMAIASPHLIRIVEGRRGVVACQSRLVPRFDYGRAVPELSVSSDRVAVAAFGADQLCVEGDVPMRISDGCIDAAFVIRAGQRVRFTLCHTSIAPTPSPAASLALEETERHWRDWHGPEDGPRRWSAAVTRSLLTLKALCLNASGGIIAAPTTSLPEQPGGTRNWDYRFCWPRDGSFAALAFAATGHPQEAVAWADWLVRAADGDPRRLAPVHGPAGEILPEERDIPWLAGYEGAKPVRVGNGAASQHQLDMFGAVAMALHQAAESGLTSPDLHWPMRRAVAEHIEVIWRAPDDGIWEVRGGAQLFTFSRIMAWTALDRAIRAAAAHGLPGPITRWRRARAEIHALVCERGFNPTLRAFTQVLDGTTLDASLLLAPLVGFLPATDPRIVGTVDAIGRSLTVGGLIKRYHTQETADGLPPGEGVFVACGFWHVAALAMMGRRAEAETAFTRLLSLQNDTGLLSEEYDPASRRQFGNFPQAFSHLSLIWAALALEGTGVLL